MTKEDDALRDAPSDAVEALMDRFIASGFGFMGLSGVKNARDLGGMPTSDGRVVRAGRLIRSGELSGARSEDIRRLKDLGLSAVVDLRTEGERESHPDPAGRLPATSFEFLPVISSGAAGITRNMGLRDLMRLAKSYERGAEGQVSRLYVEIVTSKEGVDGYRRFFDVVMGVGELDGPHAVLWHCTAGKDRTGLAAAFLERALGVPMEMVTQDYLASNFYTQPAWSKAVLAVGRHHLLPKGLAMMAHVLYSVEQESLEAAFGAIDKQWGGFDAFLEKELAMGPERVERLRDLYLVEP